MFSLLPCDLKHTVFFFFLSQLLPVVFHMLSGRLAVVTSLLIDQVVPVSIPDFVAGFFSSGETFHIIDRFDVLVFQYPLPMFGLVLSLE